MAQFQSSTLAAIQEIRNYFFKISASLNTITSGPIDIATANHIYRDLQDTKKKTEFLLEDYATFLAITESEILYLTADQRNDLYSLVVAKLKEFLTLIEADEKFEDKSITIETVNGVFAISDWGDDLRVKIGVFWHNIFQPSFEPFMTELQLKQQELKKKIDDLLNNNGESEAELVELKNARAKVSWLIDLGIIDFLIEQYSPETPPNYAKIGKIVAKFTGDKPGTIRKIINDHFTAGRNKPMTDENKMRNALLRQQLKI
jgi:hypothetical protein